MSQRSLLSSLRNGLLITFILVTLIPLSGCSEYWWTRSQPPSSAALVERSRTQLQSAITERGKDRAPVADVAKGIETSLSKAISSVKNGSSSSDTRTALLESENGFISLEGKLSIGSRAAYGELSGQLRGLIAKVENKESVDASALQLFSARTFFFLADELQVPAPNFG